MAKSGSTAWKKRSRELAKQEKRQEKLQKRTIRKEEKLSRQDSAEGEDPDLAGIVPGPQPATEV